MTAAEHIATALTLLEQSDSEFAAGDIIQGSEKLWGAASHSTIAAAKLRGWPTDSHRNVVDAARRLSEEPGEEALLAQFRVARIFHQRFYGHGFFDPFAEIDPMTEDRQIVADYVRRVVDIAGESSRSPARPVII